MLRRQQPANKSETLPIYSYSKDLDKRKDSKYVLCLLIFLIISIFAFCNFIRIESLSKFGESNTELSSQRPSKLASDIPHQLDSKLVKNNQIDAATDERNVLFGKTYIKTTS